MEPNREPQETGPEASEDRRLRELCAAHEVPAPSPGFVDDTLLRIQLDAWPVPAPSADFVDRVVEAWSGERSMLRSPTDRTLVPLRRLTPNFEVRGRRAGVALFLAGTACAAALVLAFLIGRASVRTSESPVALRPTGTTEAFVQAGGNRFGRALALTIEGVDAELGSPDGGTIRPALLLPTAPMPEIGDAGLSALSRPDDFGAEVLFAGGRGR